MDLLGVFKMSLTRTDSKETAKKPMKREEGKKRKPSRTVAGVLAIFTGAIGVHKFYQGQWKKGIFYLLFFWTGIPGMLGLLEGAHLLGSDAEPERKPSDHVTVKA